MSGQYDDTFSTYLDFNLDFLQQTSSTTTTTDYRLQTPDKKRYEKCRKAISLAKRKIIATDSLIIKYYERKDELQELEKVLYTSKEECKKVCIDFRNVTEKCTQLDNEAQCLRISNQELQEKYSKTENLVNAIQSHANQLQILVKENETVIEGLKVENQLEKATIKDYEKKIQSFKKENKTHVKHLCLLKEIVLGKRTLNKDYKAILEKIDKNVETDYEDLFGRMFSDDETDMDSHFKSPLASKAIVNKVDISLRKALKEDLNVMKYDNDLDSDLSNEHASADTGRGSSLAFSDGEKCLHSPDYFMDSPINTELTDKNIRDHVDVATSPIPSRQLVHTATSPIPAKQTTHIATSPIAFKEKEITFIAETKNKSKGVIKRIPSQCDLVQNEVEQLNRAGKIQKNAKNHKKHNENKSNLSSSSTENASNNSLTSTDNIHINSMRRVSSPIELENNNWSPESHIICSEIINEKECLELNNSDTLNLKNNKDSEIEMILSKMRFNRNLITPIPSSPFKSCNSDMQNHEVELKEVLKEPEIIKENQMANLAKRVKSLEDIVLIHNNYPPRHPKSTSKDYIEVHPVLIPENDFVLKNVEHELNSSKTSNSKIITEGNNNDMNETSIKQLQCEVALPQILNNQSILYEPVDNLENTDEECYEQEIFNFGNGNINMLSTKRHKQRKLTKLDRFRQKLVPKNKIKLISSPTRKLHIERLMLPKSKAAASMAAAALSNKSAYEKAVKVMSELRTQQKLKEIKLNTHKKRDKQIYEKTSKLPTGLPKVRPPITKELKSIDGTTTESTFEIENANDTVDIYKNYTFKTQDSKDTANTSSRDHTVKIQDANITRKPSLLGLHLDIQDKQITKRKKDKQIVILENILITDLKNCTDNSKVLKKPNQVKPPITYSDKLPPNLYKKLEALKSAPKIKVIQKTDPIGLLHDNLDTKSSKGNKSFTIDTFDSPSRVNKNMEILPITNCRKKVKESGNVIRKEENKTDMNTASKVQQKRVLRSSIESSSNSNFKTDSIELNTEYTVSNLLQKKRVLRSSIESSLKSNTKSDTIDLDEENTASKLQQKRVLRSSIESSLKSNTKSDTIDLDEENTASKLQQKRVLRSSIESSLKSNTKSDTIDLDEEYTASKLQQKRVFRSSIESSLKSNTKSDTIDLDEENTASKLQPKRVLRSSNSKADSIELNKEYTASKLQQNNNKVLRSSKESGLNTKSNSIELKKKYSALKLRPKRVLRSSIELKDTNSKRDSIELDKESVIPVVKCDKASMSPSPKKLIATRSTTKCVGNLSASLGELKEVKSFAAEINQPEFSSQKDTSLNENKDMTCIIKGTRKRQKRTSLEIPDVECKRMLRSSTLRQISIQEKSPNASDLLCADRAIKTDALNSTKEKLKGINLKTEVLQKVQQSAVSYSDIDLFDDNTESKQQIDESIGKTSCVTPKESILCVMLEKYGRQSVKNFSKKVPDSVVNTICKTIENEISHIIESSPKDFKQSMNVFVETVKKWNRKQFMAGLMQYLKDPQRKIELFSKVCTPPAPPMTKSEQILLLLLTQLSHAWQPIDVVDCVMRNMEYTLLKLNRTPEFETVESMSHLYAIMCRYFKMKSRLRLFMLDAMYCIQFKSVPLIKQCMEVWMHVLPLAHMGLDRLFACLTEDMYSASVVERATVRCLRFPQKMGAPLNLKRLSTCLSEACSEIQVNFAKTSLVTVMVYLLHFYKCDDKFNRVQDIRHLLNRKYFYNITEWNEPKIIEMFRNAIKDVKVIPLEMKLLRLALIVIAKRHGPKWCQNNIVKNVLIPMIENDSYSERVKMFCVSVLGPLLKPYPADMRVHCEIVMNMLLDMLNHNPTPQMEEAIYSSLISMSRHNYNRVVQTLLTWKPKQISPDFEDVIRDFVGEKPLRVWRAILLKITLA